MIWYEKTCEVLELPQDHTVIIKGIYNTSDYIKSSHQASIIEIYIEIQKLGEVIKSILSYNHNPSMLKIEEPLPEDVYTKYANKIIKITNKLSKTKFTDIA